MPKAKQTSKQAAKQKKAAKKANKKSTADKATKKSAAKKANKKSTEKPAAKKSTKKSAAKKANKKSTKKANKKSAKSAAKKANKKSAPNKANKKSTPNKANKKSAAKKANKKSTPNKATKKSAAKSTADKATKKSAARSTANKATKKSTPKPAARKLRPVATGPASPPVLAARRFYALPIDDDAYAASDENLTDQAGDDLVAAHLGRNYGYFGAIDKTLSGFYVMGDEGDNYYLADLRDSGQVWWQDHETRDVSLAFADLDDYVAFRDARAEAQADDDNDDDDDIAARFRPRKLKATGERRPSTADLLARYQWLMWLFARGHELRGQVIDHDDDMTRRAAGHFRHAFATAAAEAKAFAAERTRLADDPHLGIYWLLHTSVLADHARRDEVVAALAGSEHPLVHAFVATFGALEPDGDVAAAPGFRARRSQFLVWSSGVVSGEDVDRERLLAGVLADPAAPSFYQVERLLELADAAGDLDRLQQIVTDHPRRHLGLQTVAALLDARAGRRGSPAAEAVLSGMSENTDVDLLAAVIERLHPLAGDRDRVRLLVDSVLARDPYHWGVLHAGQAAAEHDGDAARVEQFAARIAPLAEVRPVMLELYAEDDDERERGLKKFRELEPAQRLLLARRLLVMASQISGDVLAAAVDVLLAAGDTAALADLQAAAVNLPDPSDFARQLGELREDGFVDLADPLLPTIQTLLLRPESGEFMADDWKEDLVEKLAPIAHEPALFDWLLAALAEDSRHELRDKILSELFIAYGDNQVVARLSEGQADRLVRLAARLGVKPAKPAAKADDDDDDDDAVFPGIHVYHAAGRVLFYFTNAGAVPALAELLASATDEELLGNLYSGLAHIKTEAALGLLRARLFSEQRQVWYLCNAVAETFDDAGHADVMAELERTRSDHGANSYAIVFLDFENDTKKKPHPYLAAIARAVLAWPEPADARARGQRKFVLMHAVRLGLESGDHELVRQAHAAAQAIDEPPYSNLTELHYDRRTDDPWQSFKARDRKQLDGVLHNEAPAPRKASKPLKKISDDALAELAGVPIDRRFLTTPDGEVWCFDKQNRLLVFDGLEVAAPKFRFVADLDDLGAFLADAERCDGHVVHWNASAGEFRDIARYGDRVLVFEGVNNGSFVGLGFVGDGPEGGAELYRKIADNPAKNWFVADAWYVPQRGGVQRTYYAPLPGGKYSDERDHVLELRAEPEALAEVEARVLALLKRPGARVACIEWMQSLRRPADMGLLEYFGDRAREDGQTPAWHLDLFAEFERLLAEWDWTPALPGLSVSRGAPADEAAIARFAAAAGAEVPALLREAWAHGPLAWRLGGRGRALLGPDDALARNPALVTAVEAVAARLAGPRAAALRALMAGAQVVIEDEQQRPVVLFVPNSPSRADGRVFVGYDVAGPPDDLWFEVAFAWFLAEDLGRPFVAALGEVCPDLLGLPYGARRHPDVVRRRYHQDGKFWEVVFDPAAAFVLTRYGKIGAAGSDKLRRFADADEARAQFDKLVKEKTGEGYRLAE